MRCLSRPRCAVAAAALSWVGLTLLLASPAEAQYFGQNKVQYKTFRYEVMKTDHFDIYFYPEERQAVEQVARMAERWNARLTRFFTHKLSSRQPLVLYASGPDFRQTNTIEGDLGEGTGGVTEPYKRRVIMPLGASLAETDHVLGHELVHAFQYDITSAGGKAGYQGGMPGLERLPLWFVEGMAEYVSLGPVDPNTAMWMRDSVQENKLPTIRKLNDPRYFPYRWGQAFWAYVAGRWGDRMVADLLSAAAATGDVELTLEKLLGVKPVDLSNQWQAALRSQYEPLIKATRPTTDYAKLLITSKGLGNDLNVSPALSPDGQQMLFLSSRSLFSIDLYVADVETGKVTKKLLETATSPHWSSLQFISSAGDWAADGKRFVLGAVTQGWPELAILDVDRGKVVQEIPFKALGEIFSPAWSPDGRYIAFSATKGGVTDLYLYDLKTSSLKALTNDAFADLQPAWSPDGKRLAFVTDRFSTDLADLKPGNYRLAICDVETGAIRPAGGFDDAKHINPQWSADGSGLYFVSDRNGISNIYRLNIGNGDISQITNLYTGVSGITDLSPTMSLASRTNALAFSVFRDQKYEIYATNAASQALNGTEPVALPGPASVLPPPTKRAGDWPAMLQNPTVGLPTTQASYPVDNYKAKLGLDFVGQPSVGVGVDRYGTYAGGSISFLWSDMLGNHSLLTALQIQSGVTGHFSDVWKDSGALVAYQDLSRRWNWAVSAQQMPYLSGSFANGYDPATGAYVEQTNIYRQTNRTASGVLAYPFNRAQRVEFSGGFTNLGFSQETRTTFYDPYTGQVLSDQSTSQELASPLNLGTVGSALVYDTAIYGATSPIRGQSYRLEGSPNFGTINFTNVLADYRKYFMPAQLYTVAARFIHYGRYGSGSGDYRLVPLYIGYPELVRGYELSSFSADECRSTVGSGCPVYDRLVGSKMMVANLEFRFPLFRPFGMRQNVYGPVPVEVAFFADAGITWGWNPYLTQTSLVQSAAATTNFGTNRPFNTKDAVSSAGVTFRVNAFGFAILQFDFARPFQRPGQGWVFSWTLAPGF